MITRAAILGASGYGGGELLRLLIGHPQIEGVQGTSRAHAGKPIYSVHPNLRGLCEESFVASPDWAWLSDCSEPVLFAAMPHGEFSKMYPSLLSEIGDLADRLTIIDLSADFRISDIARYEKHYKTVHPCAACVDDFVYGFCELNRTAIVGAKRIANPGCFATALQLGLLPLTGVADLGHVAITGITGSSGSGMTPSETTHHPTRAHDFRAYKPLSHQHMAEVEQLLEVTSTSGMNVSFVPQSAPIVRGIFVTVQFSLGGRDAKWLDQQIRNTFEDKKFIRLVSGSPRVAAIVGSNFADIGWASDRENAVIMVAVDNLMKGMAGQAVQNMNIALGLDETAGLWSPTLFP